jgi:hypothetical protein
LILLVHKCPPVMIRFSRFLGLAGGHCRESFGSVVDQEEAEAHRADHCLQWLNHAVHEVCRLAWYVAGLSLFPTRR